MNYLSELDYEQEIVAVWIRDVIPDSADVPTRERRFLEEATELVQAGTITRKIAHHIVDYVYDRPKGERYQEIGGVMVTLTALAAATGLRTHQEFKRELARIHTPEVIEKVKRRQQEKKEAGL